MRIGVFTFHRAWNYGAVLQAYALQNSICSRGHRCEIVDYRNTKKECSRTLLPKTDCSIKKRMGVIANYPIRWVRKRVFELFREQYLNTGEVFTEHNIQQADAIYDGFIFGSDQIWNYALNGNDLHYFGSFIRQNYKRNAYAASFGEVAIPELFRGKYMLELSKFNNLAVRENSGKIHVLELTGRDAQVVVDPVFLLSAEEWKTLAANKKLEYPYIFLYHLQGENTQLQKYAQHLSKATGYRIIEFQAWAKIRKPNVKPVFGGTPGDFINLIQNAEYVITDSFHCTAFSVIFEKKFWAGINPAKNVMDTRVGNLLSELGLEDRILSEEVQGWNYAAKMDYALASEKMKKQIKSSHRYIDTVLDSLQNREQGSGDGG